MRRRRPIGYSLSAHEEIEENRTRTEARLAEQTAAAEAAAGELRERTNQQAAAELDAARNEAEELLGQAREQCRAMVDEAQGLRTRVLADLARRRKVLHAQIEQLRAGRERLAETVQDVRRSVDTIAEDLFAAEDNARLAAEEAGRRGRGTTRRGHARGAGRAAVGRGGRSRRAGGGRRDDRGSRPTRSRGEPDPAGRTRPRTEPSPSLTTPATSLRSMPSSPRSGPPARRSQRRNRSPPPPGDEPGPASDGRLPKWRPSADESPGQGPADERRR